MTPSTEGPGALSVLVRRTGQALGIGPLLAFLLCLAVPVTAGAAVAAAILTGRLTILLVALVVLVVGLIGLRLPLLPLYAFVAMIPVELVLIIGDVGTLSKYVGLLFAVAYGLPRLGRLAVGGMAPAAWAYVLWALLSVAWAIDPTTASGQLATLVQLFVVALLIADVVIRRPAIVSSLMWVYSLSATATAVVGLVSYVTSGAVEGVRAEAIQNQDPAQFAAVLLPALVFGLVQLLAGRAMPLSLLVVVMTSGAVVASGTRGAWLAVGVVIVVYLLPRMSLTRRTIAVTGLVILAAAVLALPGVGDLILARADTALSSGGAGRTDIWSVAVKIYEESPVLGVGYANFPVAYTPDVVRSTAVGAYAAEHPAGSGPHDIVVGTTVELGPLGLLLLAAFLGPLLIVRTGSPDEVAIRASLAALLVSALFLDILSDRKQVWLIIGMASGLAYAARARPRASVRRVADVLAGWSPWTRRRHVGA